MSYFFVERKQHLSIKQNHRVQGEYIVVVILFFIIDFTCHTSGVMIQHEEVTMKVFAIHCFADKIACSLETKWNRRNCIFYVDHSQVDFYFCKQLSTNDVSHWKDTFVFCEKLEPSSDECLSNNAPIISASPCDKGCILYYTIKLFHFWL